MFKIIVIINEFIDNIFESVIYFENVDIRSLFNFVVLDGYSVICICYVGSVLDEVVSLYYLLGIFWEICVFIFYKRDY